MILNYRTGAKGHAKPKQCSKCEGQGWTYIQSQVRVISSHVDPYVDLTSIRLDPRASERQEWYVLNVTERKRS